MKVLVWLCNTSLSFKRYVIEPKGFMGYLMKGIACALNIPCHIPFDNLNQNNLTHGVY